MIPSYEAHSQLEKKAWKILGVEELKTWIHDSNIISIASRLKLEDYQQLKILALLKVRPAIQFYVDLFKYMLGEYSETGPDWKLSSELQVPLLEIYKEIGLVLENPLILYHLYRIKAYEFITLNVPDLPQLSEAMTYLNRAGYGQTKQAMLYLYKLAYFYSKDLGYSSEIKRSNYCRSLSDLYLTLKDILNLRRQEMSGDENNEEELSKCKMANIDLLFTCMKWGSRSALQDYLNANRSARPTTHAFQEKKQKIIMETEKRLANLNEFLISRFSFYYELLLNAHVKFGFGIMFGSTLEDADDALNFFF